MFLVLSVLAAGSVASQFALRKASPVSAPAAAEGVMAAIGGLRSIVTEAVWLRADRLQREGKYVELAQLATTLTGLEPHEPEVWSFAAWNLAYNVCAMMSSPDDRWRWILAAVRLLRDGGLRLNPRSSAVYRELSWLFELKFVKNVDPCYREYRAKWKSLVDDVAGRDAWNELGMDAGAMSAVAAKHGLKDWSSPFASAIYWSELGLKYADPSSTDAAFMQEIIRQCKIMIERGD